MVGADGSGLIDISSGVTAGGTVESRCDGGEVGLVWRGWSGDGSAVGESGGSMFSKVDIFSVGDAGRLGKDGGLGWEEVSSGSSSRQIVSRRGRFGSRSWFGKAGGSVVVWQGVGWSGEKKSAQIGEEYLGDGSPGEVEERP